MSILKSLVKKFRGPQIADGLTMQSVSVEGVYAKYFERKILQFLRNSGLEMVPSKPGLSIKLILDKTPPSSKVISMRMIQRYRPEDFGHLDASMSINPRYFNQIIGKKLAQELADAIIDNVMEYYRCESEGIPYTPINFNDK